MWYVYIVQGKDNSLYTGVSINVEKRVGAHNSGKGSKALRGKRPVLLVYTESYDSKTEALKREAEIKRFKREKKIELIRATSSMVEQFPLKESV